MLGYAVIPTDRTRGPQTRRCRMSAEWSKSWSVWAMFPVGFDGLNGARLICIANGPVDIPQEYENLGRRYMEADLFNGAPKLHYRNQKNGKKTKMHNNFTKSA